MPSHLRKSFIVSTAMIFEHCKDTSLICNHQIILELFAAVLNLTAKVPKYFGKTLVNMLKIPNKDYIYHGLLGNTAKMQ